MCCSSTWRSLCRNLQVQSIIGLLFSKSNCVLWQSMIFLGETGFSAKFELVRWKQFGSYESRRHGWLSHIIDCLEHIWSPRDNNAVDCDRLVSLFSASCGVGNGCRSVKQWICIKLHDVRCRDPFPRCSSLCAVKPLPFVFVALPLSTPE